MQRKTPRPASSGGNPFGIIFLIIFVVFFSFLLFGIKQLYDELHSISDQQHIILAKLTEPIEKKDLKEMSGEELENVSEDEYVNRIEFIRFKNEQKKAVRDLKRQMDEVRAKLKMSRKLYN